MYVALRDLRAARGRFALVGLVIALIALLSTLLSGLAAGLVDDGISGLRRLPMTDLAMEPGSGGSFSRSTLTLENLTPWQHLPGVEASPLGVSFANAKRANGKRVSIALLGVPADSFLVTRPQVRDALADRAGLVLDRDLRAEGLRVGDRVTISGSDTKLPVLGFADTGSYGHVDIAFTQLSTWQQVFYGGAARGRVSAVALRIDDPAATVGMDTAAGTETLTKEASYAGAPGYLGETRTMSLIRDFLLVISSLVVGAFFVVWTVQRTRQIALLKALGASTGYVLRDALGQIAVVLVTAAALGAGIGWAGGLAIEGGAVPFRLQPGPVLLSMLLLVGLGLAGCLVAVRRITRVDPAGALRLVD